MRRLYNQALVQTAVMEKRKEWKRRKEEEREGGREVFCKLIFIQRRKVDTIPLE